MHLQIIEPNKILYSQPQNANLDILVTDVISAHWTVNAQGQTVHMYMYYT